MGINKSTDFDCGYVQIRNEVFKEGFTAPTLGILCYLLSKPGHWKLSIAQLRKQFGVGRDYIQARIIELENAGYLQRRQARDAGYFGETEYEIFDRPQPCTEKASTVDSPLTGLPSTVNPHLVNTEEDSNKEKESNTADLFGKPKKEKKRRKAITLDEYMADCEKTSTEAIPESDPIFRYADSIKLPRNFLEVAWYKFHEKYTVGTPDKKYVSWPMAFGNSVRDGWFKLWYISAGEYLLTSNGQQAERAMKAGQ